MKLKKLYYRHEGWEVDGLDFDDLNLLVGKNASGKSRSLLTINALVKFLNQLSTLHYAFNFKIDFEDEHANSIRLEFTCENSEENAFIIGQERVEINGEEYLKRSEKGSVQLKNIISGEFDTVDPPRNKLTLHVNRDTRKYPYLEQISIWAEHSFGFKFSNVSTGVTMSGQDFDLLNTIGDIPQIFSVMPEGLREPIKTQFNSLGYQVTSISTQSKGDEVNLLIQEFDSQQAIPHHRLSQGMYRSLSLIIFLNYLEWKDKPLTLIIDDLCEGLDYERATKLGKLVFDKCKSSNIQLIATSNDSFLMDVVDIRHWSVLQRKGNSIRAINKRNSPALFEEFRYTGLSNFDFFASDYIPQHQK